MKQEGTNHRESEREVFASFFLPLGRRASFLLCLSLVAPLFENVNIPQRQRPARERNRKKRRKIRNAEIKIGESYSTESDANCDERVSSQLSLDAKKQTDLQKQNKGEKR